jgi:hypothetical protein
LHQRRFLILRVVAKPPMVAKMVTKIYFAPRVITSRNAASSLAELSALTKTDK